MEPRNGIFLAGFILLVSIREVFKWRTMGNARAVFRLNPLEMGSLFLFTAAGPSLPLLYLFTPWP